MEPRIITCKVEQTTPQKPIRKQMIKSEGDNIGKAKTMGVIG